MNDWAEGYVTEIDYGYPYFTPLNPGRARLAFLNRGLVFPEVRTACELGYGQGLSVAIHAAASTTRWYGTDFLPAQAEFAREMVAASGSGARLFADSFADFAREPDLPDFDFIGLHGVWTWISDENRRIIVDFLSRKLKEGGVLYISYNTLPGWSEFLSMRYLMTQYMERVDEPHLSGRIRKTVKFVDDFIETTTPRFYREDSFLAKQMEELRHSDERYLAHEYFNRDWHPMHFSEVASRLQEANLQYACPAYYPDHIPTINITEEQYNFLQKIHDPVFKELLYDFITNQKFRVDYWVKGELRQENAWKQSELLGKQQYILVTPRESVPLSVNGKMGQCALRSEIYSEILDVMSDHIPHTLEQLAQSVAGKKIEPAQVYQAIFLLMGMRHVEAVLETAGQDNIAERCGRINAFLRRHSRNGKDITFLASPVTGGGVNVSRVSQLFLTSIEQGGTRPEEWAEYALQNFSKLGERLVKDGRTLGMEDEKRAELRERAENFAQKSLPVLKALGVA